MIAVRMLPLSWAGVLACAAIAAQEPQQPAAPAAKPAAAPPAAPTASPERLQILLQELAGMDAAAWAARVQALQQKVAAEQQHAAKLRADAAALQEQAAAADAAARAVQAEIARLQELQKLLQAAPAPQHPPVAPAPAPASAAPASPAPAPPAKTNEPAAMSATLPAATDAPAPDLVSWAEIEPLFADRCSACHEPGEQKGGLDVTTFAAIRRGGGSGRTLVPGEPDQSRLWLMVSQQEQPFMPRNEEPLPKEQIAKVRAWIEHGASETKASARAFLAKKDAALKAQAAATAALAAPGPLPRDLPVIARNVPQRPPAVRSLARSPNAALLAMPGIRQILLFDADLHPLGVLPVDAPRVEAVAFSPDGALLVAAIGEPGRVGRAAVYDVATGRLVATCGRERDVPLAVAVHAAAGVVALGGAGKRVRVFALADGTERWAGAHDDFVLALAFSSDGVLLAAGDRNGTVQLWETDGGQIAETLAGQRPAVAALAFAPGNLLVTGDAGGSVRGFDAQSGKEQWRQQAHDGETCAVAVAADGTIASAGSDGKLRVFARGGKPVAASPAVGEWLYAVAFGPTPEVVLGGDFQGRVFWFDRREKVKELRSSVPLGPAQ